MKICMLLFLMLYFGLIPPTYAEDAVDPTATNPTNIDRVSFSKTIMSHQYERTLLPHDSGSARLVDPSGITGGRWGAVGDEPAAFRAAAAERSSWSWVGLLGLLGLLGLRKSPVK